MYNSQQLNESAERSPGEILYVDITSRSRASVDQNDGAGIFAKREDEETPDARQAHNIRRERPGIRVFLFLPLPPDRHAPRILFFRRSTVYARGLLRPRLGNSRVVRARTHHLRYVRSNAGVTSLNHTRRYTRPVPPADNSRIRGVGEDHVARHGSHVSKASIWPPPSPRASELASSVQPRRQCQRPNHD